MKTTQPDDAEQKICPLRGKEEKGKEEEGKRKEGGKGEEEGNAGSPIPIDRGWAWMVVVGCFGMHVLVVGGVKSFGVLFVELQQLYGVSAKQLGIMHGLACVLMMALGPVSNALSVRFSCRWVVFVGGVLMGCGFVSSAFVPSFPYLYFTYSILTGIGSSLAYAPSIGSSLAYAPSVVMVGHHFLKRRALANGISVSGSAVGSFLLPNLMRHLLNHYGLRGALAIIGAIMFHVCACAALFRPLTSYKPKKDKPAPSPLLNEDSGSGFLPRDDSLSYVQAEEEEGRPSPREDSGSKLSPLEDELTDLTSPVPEDSEDVMVKVDDVDDGHLRVDADPQNPILDSPTSPVSPSHEQRKMIGEGKSPEMRRLADINSPNLERKVPDFSHNPKLERVEAFDRNQTVDSEVDFQESPGLQRRHLTQHDPDWRRGNDAPKSPTLPRMEPPEKGPSENQVQTPPRSPTPRGTEDALKSPNIGRARDARKSPSLGRVGELRKSPNIARQDISSLSEGTNSQNCKNGPSSVPPTEPPPSQVDSVTTNTIRDSLEKKLARNASVNSMIAHFGSMKQTHRGEERTGSFKLHFRRDSSKSKSGSLKRQAFKGGKPILERHPSALWDARVPESLKQAIEEEKRGLQRGGSIELSILQRGSNQDLLDSPTLKRAGSKTDKPSTTKKRIGSFKAIDAAKPIRFIHERKKLLLANNLRYRSETRDAGVATPTLVANEKVPLKRFYSVEAGHHHASPMLQDSFLHRRIRQISRAESWRSESSVFASAGDLALASLQNISLSATEAEDDVFSNTSRTSGLKSILR
ncbi:hypothetical protein ACOMHN_024551 [Nucella lapillus]